MEEARISEITVVGSVLRRFRQLRRLHGTTLRMRFSANAGWVCSARAEYTAKAESAREEGSTLKCLANRARGWEAILNINILQADPKFVSPGYIFRNRRS